LAQLENNLGAIQVTLSPAHIARLDEVSAVPAGFPYTVIHDPGTRELFTGGKAEQFDGPKEPVA
jgi:hypothetical protein